MKAPPQAASAVEVDIVLLGNVSDIIQRIDSASFGGPGDANDGDDKAFLLATFGDSTFKGRRFPLFGSCPVR